MRPISLPPAPAFMMNPPTCGALAIGLGKDMRSGEGGEGGEEAEILNVPLPLDCSPQTTASPPLDRPTDRARWPPREGVAAAAVALPSRVFESSQKGREERGDKDLEGLVVVRLELC